MSRSTLYMRTSESEEEFGAYLKADGNSLHWSDGDTWRRAGTIPLDEIAGESNRQSPEWPAGYAPGSRQPKGNSKGGPSQQAKEPTFLSPAGLCSKIDQGCRVTKREIISTSRDSAIHPYEVTTTIEAVTLWDPTTERESTWHLKVSERINGQTQEAHERAELEQQTFESPEPDPLWGFLFNEK